MSRMICLLAVALVAAIGCSRASISRSAAELEPAPQGPLAEFFCINAIKPYHDKVGNEEVWTDLARRLEMARKLGVHSMRVDMWWGVIEPKKGHYEWEFPDRVMHEIRNAGLEPYPILCYNAQWLKHSPQSAEEREDFGNYVFELVSRSRHLTKQWEVWNEPNITPFWVPEPNPELYAKLLEVSYKRAKEADPEAVISAMCTAGADHKFIEGVYRLGGAQYSDVITFHDYDTRPQESILEGEIIKIRNIMRRYGDAEKPLYITELGYSTGKSTTASEVSREQQASWIVKKHLISLATGVQRFYYFKMIDDDPEREPDGFWGLYDWNYNAKLSRDAYAAMVDRVRPSEFLDRAMGVEAHRGSGEAEVQLFRNGDEIFAVAWVRNDGGDLLLKLPADQEVSIEDLFGKRQLAAAPDGDGFVRVTIGKYPVYIRNLSPRAAGLTAVKFDPPSLFISPGQKSTVQVSVANPLHQPLTVNFAALMNVPRESGVTIKLDQQSLTVPPRGLMTVPAEFAMAEEAEPFTMMNIRHGDGAAYGYEYRVYRQPSFNVHTAAQTIKGTQAVIATRFQNLTAEAAQVQVGWMRNGVALPVRRGLVEVPPGEYGEASMPAEIIAGETEITATLASTTGASATGALRLWGQPLSEEPPSIDGNLADWAAVPGIRLVPEKHQARPTGKTKLSANEHSALVHVRWTDSHLIVAADVTDATPLINPHAGTELWRGDSLELYIGFGGPTSKTVYTPGYFQIGLMPGDSGKDPYVWNWKPANPSDENERVQGHRVQAAEVAVAPSEKGWTIEAAIPLAEFGQQIVPLQALAFDVHLNNKDNAAGEINDLVLIWNGNDQNWRDPSGWGVAVAGEW